MVLTREQYHARVKETWSVGEALAYWEPLDSWELPYYMDYVKSFDGSTSKEHFLRKFFDGLLPRFFTEVSSVHSNVDLKEVFDELRKEGEKEDIAGLMEVLSAMAAKGYIPPLRQKTTPLIDAITEGKYEKLNQLLEEGEDLHERCWDGRTALLYACKIGDRQAVSTLISAGAPITTQRDYGDVVLVGETALMEAISGALVRVEEGEEPEQGVVLELLKAGANVMQEDRLSDNALTHSVGEYSSTLSKLLLLAPLFQADDMMFEKFTNPEYKIMAQIAKKCTSYDELRKKLKKFFEEISTYCASKFIDDTASELAEDQFRDIRKQVFEQVYCDALAGFTYSNAAS